MIRAIFGFLLGIRKIFQKFGGKLFNLIRDPETGKFKWFAPETWKRIIYVVLGTFFAAILFVQLFSGKKQLVGGLEDYRKEMTPKVGIGSQEQSYKAVFGEDPLAALAQNGDKNALNGNNQVANPTGDNANVDNGPQLAECVDLIDKLKKGTKLSDDEAGRAKTCIDKNITGLTPDQLAAAQALLNSKDLTPEEQALLRKALNGETLTDAEKALIKALESGDTALARAAIAAQAAGNIPLADALTKQIQGQALNPDEKSLVDRFQQLLAEGNKGNGGGNTSADIQTMAKDVAERQGKINDLQDQIIKAQKDAASAGEKLAKGETLTPAEQAALQRLAELEKQRQALQAKQDAQQKLLAQLMERLRTTLASVQVTMQQAFPSGVSVEMNTVDCRKVKSLYKKPGAKKNPNAGPELVGLDGKPLDADKIRLVKLMRKNQIALERAKRDAANPYGAGDDLGQRIDAAAVLGEGNAGVEIGNLIVFSDKSLKGFNLTPDMKIPAVLDSQILVSDKGHGQTVRVRIIENVRDPETSQIVIPKGSLAIAQSGSFDPDVGTMDLSFERVTVGSGKVLPIKLEIGSADGTVGLKGEVRDTRGKYLLGAFITAFSAGALNWFSQQQVQPYLNATDAGNALTGAALGGGAEVMTQIAQLYAGDLQNAARIFYVPKGIPVVLFPQ